MNVKQSAYFCKSNNYLGHMNRLYAAVSVHNLNYYQNYTRHFNVRVWYLIITDVWFIKYLVCSRRNFIVLSDNNKNRIQQQYYPR